MNQQHQNSKKDHFIPFVLGNTKASLALASKVYKKCRISCFIIDTERSWRNFFSPAYFIPLTPSEERRLLCEQLIDLAKQYPNAMPILVPTTAQYSKAIEQNRDLLERYFIIREPNALLSDSPLENIYH